MTQNPPPDWTNEPPPGGSQPGGSSPGNSQPDEPQDWSRPDVPPDHPPGSEHPSASNPGGQPPGAQYPEVQYPEVQYPETQYPETQYPGEPYPPGAPYSQSGQHPPESQYPGAPYPPGGYPAGGQYPQGGYPPGTQYPPGMPTSYQPQQAGGRDRTSLYGWLGIVIGFLCCAIAGIVLGVLSIRDAKRFNNSPVLGYLAIALSVVNAVVGAFYAYRR